MGCGSSKLADIEPHKQLKGASESMLAGMTKGELRDYECPHNARIEAALAAARAEIEQSKGRYVEMPGTGSCMMPFCFATTA